MNKTKRNCYRTNKGDKFQRPTACLTICINLALPMLAIHFPACAQLCFWNSVSALNYPQVLHWPNDFSIHDTDSLASWPHNFSSFFFSVIFNFTVYQEPTHVATPWSQSSDESTLPAKFWKAAMLTTIPPTPLPAKFWIVSFPLYPQPPTFCLSYLLPLSLSFVLSVTSTLFSHSLSVTSHLLLSF